MKNQRTWKRAATAALVAAVTGGGTALVASPASAQGYGSQYGQDHSGYGSRYSQYDRNRSNSGSNYGSQYRPGLRRHGLGG